ncbi:MAG: hypothetical protein ACREEE_12250 [Dongiaceae bacterium]
MTASGGADGLVLPLASGADPQSPDVVLVVGGAVRDFADSLALPTHDRRASQHTYFRLEFLEDFAVGGSYAFESVGDEFNPGDTGTVSLGASMNLDAWTFGIGWANGDTGEILVDLGGDDDNVVSFTTSYAVRPGIRIDGLLEYRDDKIADSAPVDSGLAIGLGTLINF